MAKFVMNSAGQLYISVQPEQGSKYRKVMKLCKIQSLNYYYYYVVMPCANDSNKHLITHDTKTVVKHRHLSLDHYNLLTLEISQMPTGGHAYVLFLAFVKQNHVAA
jgi:hypothetical protein